MHSLAPGDLVWIPANTLIEYQAFMMGRTKVPTYGLVIETQNRSCGMVMPPFYETTKKYQ